MKKLKELKTNWKDKKKRKETRRKIRKIRKRLFNKKNFVKVVIAFTSIALVASYVLPYIIR